MACCRGCACNTESSIMAKSIVWNISEWATMPKLHNNPQLRCIKKNANHFSTAVKKSACFLIFPPLEIGWLLFLILRAESEQAEKVWTWTWSGRSYYILCICGPPTLISNFRGIFQVYWTPLRMPPERIVKFLTLFKKPLTPPPFFVWTSCCKFLCWGGGWVGYQTRSAYQPLLTHPCPYGMFLDPEITSKKTIAAHNKSFGIKQKLQHNFLHRFALPPP